MALDGVPWAIGVGQADGQPGAELPADALRTASYTGTEGVFEAGDFKVAPTGTPSGRLMVAAGAARVINRSPGGERQAYVVRNTTSPQAYVEPAPTTSSGGRSDLIVCRVEDPQYSPWQPYGDADAIRHGPYAFMRVIPGVPSSLRSARELTGALATQSMIAVARIDIPASTAVFNGAMLVDLRELDRPRRQRTLSRVDLLDAEHDLGTTDWLNWPSASSPLVIPPWAGRMVVRTVISGVWAPSQALAAQLRTVVSPFGAGILMSTRSTVIVEKAPGDARNTYEISDDIVVPAAARGRSLSIYTQGAKYSGNTGGFGVLRAGNGSSVVYDVEFVESIS